LIEPEEALKRFFDVFDPVIDHLGTVLVQLPPSLQFDYERTKYFYNVLKNNYARYNFAMEIRHNTWLTEESLGLMAEYDVSFVISQSGNVFPYAEAVTAKDIYIRFHGPGYLYASQYTNEMLNDYAAKCKAWISKGHRIWAFFNNDVNGYAIEDSQKLIKLLE
jgi:uncharacterized protein YecE (DUF72 family)